MHKKLKKSYYGTTNLRKRAKTRVRVVTDIQNFALRAHCVGTACMAFPNATPAPPGTAVHGPSAHHWEQTRVGQLLTISTPMPRLWAPYSAPVGPPPLAEPVA